MSAASSNDVRRFNRGFPCPVCSGFDELNRGKGRRCSGFIGSDGKYAHCSRKEHAGKLLPEAGGTFAHLLKGKCKCGATHHAGAGPRIGGVGNFAHPVKSALGEEEAVYPYFAASGKLLYEVVRFPGKQFRQRVTGPDGRWIWRLGDTPRVLYRLPDLNAAHVAKTVWVVEGEKDVETLTELGHLATCNPMGAGKWSSVAELARTVLAGRCVQVIADLDDVGRQHARDVAASLQGAVLSVDVYECTRGKDVTEHLTKGGTLDVDGSADGLLPMADQPSPSADPGLLDRVELKVPDDDALEPGGDVDGSFPPPPSDPPPAPKPEPPSGGDPAPSATSGTQHPVTLAQAFETRRQRGPLVRMPTGIEGIDSATCGGIPFGSTVFVVGAPDAAKTLLLFAIAIAWAREGVIVGFMAVDEEIDDLVTRLAQQTPKDASAEGEITHFTRRDYEAGASEVVDHIEEKIGPLPILFFDAAWTVERATAYLADEGKRLGKRSAFFADSLQTVRSETTPDDASERRVVSDNAKALRLAAVRHGMTTLSTSESNREYSKAKRKGEAAIAMSAGAESRSVEFTARVLFVLSAVEDSNLIEVEIPKNKLGPRKTFHLAIDRATQTLSDAPSPELVPKVSRSEAAAERRRLQATETAKRKADKGVEDKQHKAAAAAKVHAAQDRAFVEILRANTGGVAVVDMRAKLTAKLGSLSHGAERVIAERIGDAVRHGPAPKPAHHLTKLFVLVEDKVPPHLRRPVSTTENEAAQ